MTTGAGVLRSAGSLAEALSVVDRFGTRTSTDPGPLAWEVTNLHTVAAALVTAACRREETRGCHWREDFGGADEAWRGHLLASIDENGVLEQEFQPLPTVVPA
jgi:L-aspartate oxidase